MNEVNEFDGEINGYTIKARRVATNGTYEVRAIISNKNPDGIKYNAEDSEFILIELKKKFGLKSVVVKWSNTINIEDFTRVDSPQKTKQISLKSK